MPRANRHILAGHTYHLTHRCHCGAFLLRFARDRQAYRTRLRAAIGHWAVRLLNYCLTSNHVHLLCQADGIVDVAGMMKEVAGGMAQAYNLRKGRGGAFWTDRYHATMVGDGSHLWRCMRYIDLNMVRAGVVTHPVEWEWTGWGELMGLRRRNRLLDMPTVLEALECEKAETFRKQYAAFVEEALVPGSLQREAWWSESLAVGSDVFVNEIREAVQAGNLRRRLGVVSGPGGETVLRESSGPYGAENVPENRAMALSWEAP